MNTINSELLVFGILFFVGGVLCWFLPRFKPPVDESKVPKKLLMIVFRMIGIVLTLAVLFSGSLDLATALFFVVCVVLLVFPSHIIRIVYLPSSKESQRLAHIFSIGLIALSIFLVLASLFPSRFPMKQEGKKGTIGRARG